MNSIDNKSILYPDRTRQTFFIKPIKIPLKSVLNVTVALGAVLAFFMGRELVSPVYTAGFLTIFAAAFFIEWRGVPHLPHLLIDLATLVILGTIFTRMRRNYIIEALMEALLLMISVKMLEDKRPRDYIQMVLLEFFMVIVYAMLSMEKAFILYCFGMGLVLTLTLILSTWLDREPDAAVSRAELRQICGRAGALFGVMLPVCLVLFFCLPRTAVPIWGTRGQYGNTATGFSDQVRLGDASSIQTNSKIAFRADMEQLPANQTPYWRGTVLDYFEGNIWISSAGRGGRRGGFVPEPDARMIEQEIFLEAGNRGYLFALDQPLEVTGIDADRNGDGVFRYASRAVGRRVRYGAVSVLSSRMTPRDPGFNKRRYLIVPSGFAPRLRALAQERTRGMTDREKVEDIMGFLLSSEFSYSLEGLPNARDALEQFVLDRKRGNCEYFATAMATMLRMTGVPARLVTGYRGGIYNEMGGYYIVQEQNAHVWVEVWDDEIGAWRRHDPTPPGSIPPGGLSASDTLALYLDLLDYQWTKIVVNYNWEVQAEFARTLRDIARNPRANLTPTSEGLRSFGAALSGPVSVLGAVTVCAAVFYYVRALKKRRPEIALLEKFNRAMTRLGYHRHESEGLSEFLDRVGDERVRLLALPFVRGFEAFYYKDRPMDGETQRWLGEQIRRIKG